MTLDEANKTLCRHRDAALTHHARSLLSNGASIEDKAFRESLSAYAVTLEKWRTDAMSEIRQKVQALADQVRMGASLH